MRGQDSMQPCTAFIVVFAMALSISGAVCGELPTRPGTCVWTNIERLEHRLGEGKNGPFLPDSGSAVESTNGGDQVSYEELDAVHHSRVGDRVLMCLVSIPQHCPKGDNRGRVYTTTNLRTEESWTMADSEHRCGGA